MAGPNPCQTGVVGLKVWVRSTNDLLEIMRHASASESPPEVVGAGRGAAQPMRIAAKVPVNPAVAGGNFNLMSNCDM